MQKKKGKREKQQQKKETKIKKPEKNPTIYLFIFAFRMRKYEETPKLNFVAFSHLNISYLCVPVVPVHRSWIHWIYSMPRVLVYGIWLANNQFAHPWPEQEDAKKPNTKKAKIRQTSKIRHKYESYFRILSVVFSLFRIFDLNFAVPLCFRIWTSWRIGHICL